MEFIIAWGILIILVIAGLIIEGHREQNAKSQMKVFRWVILADGKSAMMLEDRRGKEWQ